MKIKNRLALLLILLGTQVQAIVPERVNWWKFDNSANLLQPEDGYSGVLSLTGTHQAAAGPAAGNGSVLIGPGSYYRLQHTIAPNGGGNKVNEYSIQVDFKVPSTGVWHSFFQTDPGNTNDGDLFINTSGNIGVAAVGYSSFTIIPNEWYRLVISVKNGHHFNYYLDGNLIHEGVVQNIDERFSLENILLIFADEDAEDGLIYCSELGIWDKALSSTQVLETGGVGHTSGPYIMTRIPYLQAPEPNSMTVCWHDTARTVTRVDYGVDPTLGSSQSGSSEIISTPYCWHTVKLEGLQPATRYFYKVISGDTSSPVYSFKTMPGAGFTGKLRFLLLSDTHASDTTMAGIILRAARSKISELYGPDIENHLNGILHSGDIVVSGSTPGHYTTQFFKPISALSANVPTMVVAGNHEGENAIFYNYLKIDDLSAFPNLPGLNEKIWSLRSGNSVFIGLNTNISDQYGTTQANWLDQKLNDLEGDPEIDFVFLFFHHPPFSELWKYVNTFDAGSGYVKNSILPLLRNYTKTQMIHYGHTHGYERGTVQSDQAGGDFRVICGGGSGGPLDPWAEGENQDLNDVHITISNYIFQILEIDVAGHSCLNRVFSLGTPANPHEAGVLDTWYKKANQPAPQAPVIENVLYGDQFIQFNTSDFSGIDSIMTAELQITDSANANLIAVDTLVQWKNIYGINAQSEPVDLNVGIDLSSISIPLTLLQSDKAYTARLRHRDHNLKWSPWSPAFAIKMLGIDDTGQLNDYFLKQNYPNPFRSNTTIIYNVPEMCEVVLQIYDSNLRLIDEIKEGVKFKGTYQVNYNSEKLSNETYYYKLITGNFSESRKMVRIK
ncbi:MAG: metallophosphoesterase [Bacteroidales bacterium]|nr:metallophosphoesterase [Bacteroidales bacterium]